MFSHQLHVSSRIVFMLTLGHPGLWCDTEDWITINVTGAIFQWLLLLSLWQTDCSCQKVTLLACVSSLSFCNFSNAAHLLNHALWYPNIRCLLIVARHGGSK
jgi:hypothetical protein